MIAELHVKLRGLLQQAASKFARATGMPAVVAEETHVVHDEEDVPKAERMAEQHDRVASLLPSLAQALGHQAPDRLPRAVPPSIEDLDRSTDMNASLDTLAEQMLTLVEIVSAQEKDIKALKEQSRRLEEHDQAIAVAFSTFFHVLSAGRVAKLGEIANILNHIITIAQQEGRPPASIKFLQDLAGMLQDEPRDEAR